MDNSAYLLNYVKKKWVTQLRVSSKYSHNLYSPCSLSWPPLAECAVDFVESTNWRRGCVWVLAGGWCGESHLFPIIMQLQPLSQYFLSYLSSGATDDEVNKTRTVHKSMIHIYILAYVGYMSVVITRHGYCRPPQTEICKFKMLCLPFCP
jgi:hypothetical protein